MTDKPKPPAKPGMEEVSAKFVDEAEATAKAAARTARDAIEAVMKEVGGVGDDETLIQNTYRKVLALRTARSRDLPDEGLDEWINEHDRLEGKIGIFPAETLRDVETKLAILCDRLRENLSPQYSGDANDIIIALAARDDLGRLAAVAPPEATSKPEDPVLALKREWDARYERFRSETDEADKVMNPLHNRLMEAEFAIHRTPATTPAGVAVKIWLWACTFSPDWETPAGQDWWEIPVADMPDILDHMPVASALQDLERMAGEGTATTQHLVGGATGTPEQIDELQRLVPID